MPRKSPEIENILTLLDLQREVIRSSEWSKLPSITRSQKLALSKIRFSDADAVDLLAVAQKAKNNKGLLAATISALRDVKKRIESTPSQSVSFSAYSRNGDRFVLSGASSGTGRKV